LKSSLFFNISDRRRFLTGMAATGAVALFGLPELGKGAAFAQEAGGEPVVVPDTEEQRIADLISCNHVMFDLGLADAMGHPSVRSKNNPSHYYMAQSIATGLVSRDDIVELDENSKKVGPAHMREHGERFIHGEIYRVRPDVQAVVHCHTPEVIPFGVTGTPMRPLLHMAGFLVDGAPVFDVREVKDNGGHDGMLVENTELGRACAQKLGKSAVVLMRGHGMSTVGATVQQATARAWYTYVNAVIALDTQRLGGKPIIINEAEALGRRPGRLPERNWPLWKARADARSARYIEEYKKTGVVPMPPRSSLRE
jgi:HCOMODA/2-hydroxy-3-carboxy-muconic semialdehyde decarboxylase